jgi:hypothetical protein
VRFSGQDRSYIIDYIVKLPSADLGSILGTLNYIIFFAEDSNYYTCYVKYFDRQDIIWERILSNRLPAFDRYTVTTEVTIPKKRRSSFTRYWTEIQKTIMYDKAIRVKMYSLKEQYRIF